MHPQNRTKQDYWLARIIFALCAIVSLLFTYWWAGAVFAAVSFATGVGDRSIGREISDRRIGPVTDNAISWGVLIFGGLAGLGIGLLRHGSTTWGTLALVGVAVAGLFQVVVELTLPKDSPFKAWVGGISGIVVTALVILTAAVM